MQSCDSIVLDCLILAWFAELYLAHIHGYLFALGLRHSTFYTLPLVCRWPALGLHQYTFYRHLWLSLLYIAAAICFLQLLVGAFAACRLDPPQIGDECLKKDDFSECIEARLACAWLAPLFSIHAHWSALGLRPSLHRVHMASGFPRLFFE